MEILLKQISALEKVFLSDSFESKKELYSATALQGERFSYQVMNCYEHTNISPNIACTITVDSPIKDFIKLYSVGNVPSELPAYRNGTDDDYITSDPGMFPDVLFPVENDTVTVTMYSHSVWVDVNVPEDLKPGKYPITLTFTYLTVSKSVTFELEVIGAKMPLQKTIFTQWFHSDCIANFYKVDVFSEEYWTLTQNFVKTAVKCGINMLLTPVFTPPLDTKVGNNRRKVQLVDVYFKNGEYSFGFDKFERWVKMAQSCGITYFEISHLFTQWGAEFTPQIHAEVDGEEKQIFGWDVRADSEEYKVFLNAFIPKLTSYIKKLGIQSVTYFHVSDEPNDKHLESYKTAKELLSSVLGDEFKIIDALSNYAFYERGLVEHPVVLNEHIGAFLEHNVKDLWTYTCCGPNKIYSNRFMAMPSGRNRVIGAQMYKYDVKGFLHWGYNYYYSTLSVDEINPYITTDSNQGFPSGDAFSVYPYKDGAIESIRSRVFYDALQDIRAFELLESFIGKEKVVALIEEYKIKTFADYTHDYDLLLNLRLKVNEMIKAFI